MEEKKEVTHSLHLEQRGHGLITGVTEMKSFDEENIFMETSQGTLAIRGSSLHVCRLELEKGEAEIEGKVDSLIYTQGRKEKKKGADNWNPNPNKRPKPLPHHTPGRDHQKY